jgi:type I restriction enzyme, S subunit
MEVRPGYKQTQVGVLPDEWEVKLLPEVLRFRGGKAHEQHIFETGRYVCVNSKFISTDGKVRKYSSVNSCPAEKGDVLMVMSDLPNGRALAKAYLVEEGDTYAVNQRVCALTAYHDCPEYLFYVLNRNPYFLKFDDGVSQTHLLNNVFQKCPIPIPRDIDEQRAIATALSDVDAVLGGLDRLITKKRDLKQAVMQQLLTGQTRLPGFHGEWEVKRIMDVASPCSDRNTAGETLPVLACSKHFGFVDSLGFFKNQVFSKDLSTYRLIRRDEIGYPANHVEEGSIGLQDLYDTALVSPIYVVFRVTDDVNSFFLHRLLKLDSYRQRFRTATTSSVDRRGSLRWPAFSEITVRLPPTKTEQTAIATVLSDMDAEVATLEARRDKTRDLKQAMMQELLTGKTRLVPVGGAHA